MTCLGYYFSCKFTNPLYKLLQLDIIFLVITIWGKNIMMFRQRIKTGNECIEFEINVKLVFSVKQFWVKQNNN